MVNGITVQETELRQLLVEKQELREALTRVQMRCWELLQLVRAQKVVIQGYENEQALRLIESGREVNHDDKEESTEDQQDEE